MRFAPILLLAGSCVLLTAGSPPARATLCRRGEATVFSFVTKQGKTVCLCEGSGQAYLAYRFGTLAKVDLQYPAVLDPSSWRKFTYAFYLRGGGLANAGQDINQLSFSNGGVKYQLHQDYSAEEAAQNGNGTTVGIEVTVRGKTTRIGAQAGTVSGDILRFRDNDKIGKGELE